MDIFRKFLQLRGSDQTSHSLWRVRIGATFLRYKEVRFFLCNIRGLRQQVTKKFEKYTYIMASYFQSRTVSLRSFLEFSEHFSILLSSSISILLLLFAIECHFLPLVLLYHQAILLLYLVLFLFCLSYFYLAYNIHL